MIKITDEDIKKYVEAQKLKSYRCPISRVLFKQNKYGLYRWKVSGLPMQKYLLIADNEEKYLHKIERR